MNKKQLWIGILVLVAVTILGILLWIGKDMHSFGGGGTEATFTPPVVPKVPAPSREIPTQVVDQVRDALAERENALQHPSQAGNAKFYGKVTDDKGTAIAGARIIISPVVDKSNTHPIVTDAKGRFSVEGISPASSVFVSKSGYQTAIAINGQFHYDQQAKNPTYSQPQTPALFALKPQ